MPIDTEGRAMMSPDCPAVTVPRTLSVMAVVAPTNANVLTRVRFTSTFLRHSMLLTNRYDEGLHGDAGPQAARGSAKERHTDTSSRVATANGVMASEASVSGRGLAGGAARPCRT